MAIRTLTYDADTTGVVPSYAQYAGVQGDHNATTVIVNLSADLVEALQEVGAVYHFEFLDGMNEFDPTPNAALESGETSVSIDLPNGWTSAGGQAELRLVISQLDDDEVTLFEAYTLPCRLLFESYSSGCGITRNSVIKGLTTLIENTESVRSDANTAATNANLAADAANTAAGNANTAITNANNAALAANAAATNANEKATVANNAATHANAAADEANISAGLADSAATEAEGAASLANSAASAANTAAESANTATDDANEATEAALYAANAANEARVNVIGAMANINAVDGIPVGDGEGGYEKATAENLNIVDVGDFYGYGTVEGAFLEIGNRFQKFSRQSVVYVAKGGDDSNNGRTPFAPKLTIASALTVASGMVSSYSRAVVQILDAGEYTENINIPSGVDIIGHSATLIGRMDVNNDNNVWLGKRYASESSQFMTYKNGTGISRIYAELWDSRGKLGPYTGGTIAYNYVPNSIMYITGKTMIVGQSASGIRENSSGSGHIHANVEDLYLAGNFSRGIFAQGANGHIVAQIHHILKMDAPTNTTGIDVTGTNAKVECIVNEIATDVPYNDAVGGLSLTCNRYAGTPTGTAYYDSIYALSLKASIYDLKSKYAAKLTGTASSDTLLTLPDSADVSLFAGVKALGKSTQSGTPAPDAPVAVTGVTPTKVTLEKKNIFDKAKATASTIIQADGSIQFNATYSVSDFIMLETGKTYVVSGRTASRIVVFNSSKVFVRSQESGQTITLSGTERYVRFNLETANINAVQMESGSTASAYEAYAGVDYTLPTLTVMHGIGSVTDSVDIVSGAETRNFATIAFSGGETWTYDGNNATNTVYFYTTVSNLLTTYPYTGLPTLLCTHFTPANWQTSSSTDAEFVSRSSVLLIRINKSRLTGWDDGLTNTQKRQLFTDWLAAQHTAGTPVTVVYQRNTPVITQHTAQIIPQPYLTANIFTDIGSPVSAEYSRDIAYAFSQKADKTQEAWTTPTLLNGWTALSGRPPQYMKDSMGFVHMRGIATGGTTSSQLFALPAGYRLADSYSFPTVSNAVFGAVSISSAVVHLTGSTTNVQLNGITYRAEA